MADGRNVDGLELVLAAFRRHVYMRMAEKIGERMETFSLRLDAKKNKKIKIKQNKTANVVINNNNKVGIACSDQ